MANNKVQVTIAGMTYTLVSDTSEEELKNIASYVDRKIKEVDNEKLTREMQLVLASLNISDEMGKLISKYKDLEEEAKEPIEKYPVILKQVDRLKAENEKIKEEYQRNNQEFIKSVEKTEELNLKINELNAQIDRQDKINKSKDEDLKKSRESIKNLQVKLSQLQKEVEMLKKDI